MDELKDGDAAFVSCNVKVEGDVVRVFLAGDLDLSTVASVRSVIEDARGEGRPTLVFDLSQLRFMDSSGLGLLIDAARHCEEIELARPSPPVRRLIEISGLQEILPMRA